MKLYKIITVGSIIEGKKESYMVANSYAEVEKEFPKAQSIEFITKEVVISKSEV